MVGQLAMASSGPDEQTATFPAPAPAPHTQVNVVLPSFAALTSGIANLAYPEPYTPNEMSAAETLAAMSDSRPSTSHAADHSPYDHRDSDSGGDDDDDDYDGGIALFADTNSAQSHGYGPFQPPVAPQALAEDHDFHSNLIDFLSTADEPPSPPSAIPSSLPYPAPTYAALDYHAAALEALSMDQEPTLPVAILPPVPEIPPAMAAPGVNPVQIHIHIQDYMAHAYEDHLNLQDNTAFMSPHVFYLQATSHKDTAMGLEEPERDRMSVITRQHLAGEERDYQGIIWSKRMLRKDFRQKRTSMERARLHKVMRQYGERPPPIPNNENYFSFRQMDKRHRPWGPHFQLRNVMAVNSRQNILYAKRLQGIYQTDASGSDARTIIDTTKYTANGNMCMITTLAATDDVLVAGGFDGEYAVVDLRSAHGPATSMDVIRDWAPETKSYITNHVHLFKDRSTYTPQAVLSSNDHSLRVLDCATNTFRYKFPFKAAVNCSATSPDGRLRVIAGDFPETLITNAETGEVLQTLRAHKGDAFACAWADDGVHVASAAQDGTIAVWDARTWNRLAHFPSELSIPRVLKFSPVGSGPRVLVSAEADDYVSIINATTFDSKQTFDFFGQTGGVDFTPDGHSLFVANSEYGLGGIIELERAGGWNSRRVHMGVEDAWDEDARVDWGYESEIDDDCRVICGTTQRDRWGLDVGSVDV